jgi:hypothetical protein
MVLSDSRALEPLSLAIASGGGRRRASGDCATLMVDMLDVILEDDRFLLCPRLCAPVLPIVFALARFAGGRTRSVRICLWKRVPVAASDSAGMSSLTCTVWACCRRLSSREKRREQWHWKGRSPVCFLEQVSRAGRKIIVNIPNMPCQMFASREAQVAGRKVCAEEALTLLLLGPSARVAGHAVIVRAVLVVLAHLYVLLQHRVCRPVRAATAGLALRRGCLAQVAGGCERRRRQRPLSRKTGEAVASGCLCGRVLGACILGGLGLEESAVGSRSRGCRLVSSASWGRVRHRQRRIDRLEGRHGGQNR